MRSSWLILCVSGACLAGLTACSRSNNLLLGEIRAKLGSHDVLVTDCYRTSAPEPVSTTHRRTWEPCRDARIVIEEVKDDAERLSVNGTDYGALNAGDSVLVDHGAVSIQRKSLAERAGRRSSLPLDLKPR